MWQGESGGTRLDWMLRDSVVYPETRRDWIKVYLQNGSRTLEA